MKKNKISETVTENIFRDFYGANTFIEKSAIPDDYGFRYKNKTNKSGYPDFFRDETDYAIVVEAKSTDHDIAKSEVRFYMENNSIEKDVVGLAVSRQSINNLQVSYYVKIKNSIQELQVKNTLLQLFNIHKIYRKL